MFGNDSSNESLGVVPLSIFMLYKKLNEKKANFGIKSSVKLSVMELIVNNNNTCNEKVKDLLYNSLQGIIVIIFLFFYLFIYT
jgi:hypothetical protein